MRIALISDIHANLPAVEAVLADIERRDAAATYHLGDLVGYAPWPNETVALMRERAIAGVAGNYDSTVGAGYKHCGCRYEDPQQEALSHLSFQWTCAHTTDINKRYLASLPFRLDVKPRGGHAGGASIALVHGTPTLNTVYWTEDRGDEFCRRMAAHAGLSAGDTIVFGHTHKPWRRLVDGVQFLNAGSVGRPKDGDWRACYVLLEIGAGVAAEFVRVEYDLARATGGIRASDLPHEFAGYLERGGQTP